MRPATVTFYPRASRDSTLERELDLTEPNAMVLGSTASPATGIRSGARMPCHRCARQHATALQPYARIAMKMLT
jgi:hypothetical protein